jgi:TonB family protein
MVRNVRRRQGAARTAPQAPPSLPENVRIVLPPRARVKPAHVWGIAAAMALVAATGYAGYRFFAGEETATTAEETLPDVVMEVPPEPDPDPEPEAHPEPEAEPEADMPDLLTESEGAAEPGNAVALDLALGTGSEGLAVAGASASGAGRSGRTAYEPGQVDKNPEPAQTLSPPEMPRKALEQGVSGAFVATFVVNASGRVESIAISGAPTGYGFEDAIRASLLKRRYKPAMAGGVPVPVKIRQPFDFRLE